MARARASTLILQTLGAVERNALLNPLSGCRHAVSTLPSAITIFTKHSINTSIQTLDVLVEYNFAGKYNW